jgi:flagellar assembly protein FliH
MILLSEPVQELADLPERLILPLEFRALSDATDSAAATESSAERAIEDDPKPDELARLEQRLALKSVEMEEEIASARKEAWNDARETMGRECDDKVAFERAAVIKVCTHFDRERVRYFADVEAEVVRLSLSIAARILNREVEFDPLLLRGVVKAALTKVYDDSSVTLRVPAAHASHWSKTVMDGEVAIRVVGDAQLDAGECVLETTAGRVELGVKAQLQEIESGFFNLLGQRPV